jgi:phage-related protein
MAFPILVEAKAEMMAAPKSERREIGLAIQLFNRYLLSAVMN